jgi:Zn-dependent peptidase ImmA (M78 family)
MVSMGLALVVARLPSRSRLAGCMATGSRFPGAILVNANHPVTRQRYTATHEIAHLLLDDDLPLQACDTAGAPRPGPRSTRELRADVFASAFLLPERAIRGTFGRPGTILDKIEALKRDYGLSHAAVISRLRALSVLTDADARSLQKMSQHDSLGDRNRVPPHRVVGQSLAALLDDAGFASDYAVLPDEEVLP